MTAVYLAGATALFSYFSLSYFVFKKKSKDNEAVADHETLRIFDECRSSLKIRRRVSLIYGEESMLSGVFLAKNHVKARTFGERLKSDDDSRALPLKA